MKDSALSYLHSLGLFKVKPGLERIRAILSALADPQDKARCVLVAGTNGKGSTSAAIASILQSAGFKTGLYTSPHLIRIHERIKINGADISDDEFSNLIFRIKDSASRLNIEPSFFEVLTLAGFLHFAEQKADFSVIEVGMGGLWDATNATSPLVSVITNVSMDHAEFLGDTIRQIAGEKAGIIKPDTPAITAAKGDALDVIRAKAREEKSPLSVMGVDFTAEGVDNFRYRGRIWEMESVSFSLAGAHQIENAALAIAAIETLSSRYGINIAERDVRSGLSETKWQGRMETLRPSPLLILDGAHNEGGAAALRESLEKMYPKVKFQFLVGMLSDKRHEEYFREISPVAESFIITEPPSERAADARKLAALARNFCDKVSVIENWQEAFEKIWRTESPTCVTGSLYLIGAVKGFIAKQS